MNDYGMSRHTVRSALAELVHLGLIRRSPRRGTIVTGDGRGAEFTASLVPSLPADAGGRTLLSIRRMICDEDTAARTGFALLTPLITLTMLTKGPDGRARRPHRALGARRRKGPHPIPHAAEPALRPCASRGACGRALPLHAPERRSRRTRRGVLEALRRARGLSRTRRDPHLSRPPSGAAHSRRRNAPAGVRACETVFLRSTAARTAEHEGSPASEPIPTD